MMHPSTTDPISERAQLMQKGTLYMDYGLWLLSDETGRITLTGWSETGSDSTDPNATTSHRSLAVPTRCVTTARSYPRAFRTRPGPGPRSRSQRPRPGLGRLRPAPRSHRPQGCSRPPQRLPADHAADWCPTPRQRAPPRCHDCLRRVHWPTTLRPRAPLPGTSRSWPRRDRATTLRQSVTHHPANAPTACPWTGCGRTPSAAAPNRANTRPRPLQTPAPIPSTTRLRDLD